MSNSFAEKLSCNAKFEYRIGDTVKTFIICDGFPDVPETKYQYLYLFFFSKELNEYVVIQECGIVANYFYIDKEEYLKVTDNGKKTFLENEPKINFEALYHAYSDSIRGYRIFPEGWKFFDIKNTDRLYCPEDNTFYLHIKAVEKDYALAPIFCGNEIPLITNKKTIVARGYAITPI